MSTRHLLNIGMGTVALLLAASVALVFNSMGDLKADQSRIDLAVAQQGLVKEISYQVEALANAGNLVTVKQTREKLGSSILKFDLNLSALLNGGTITNDEGKDIQITGAQSSFTKNELGIVAEVWIQTGLPLANLAAGEFSIFSSAGQSALTGQKDNAGQLVNHLDEAAKGMQAEIVARHDRGNLARWTALGLTAGFIGLGIFRFKPTTKSGSKSATQTSQSAPAPSMNNEHTGNMPATPPTNAPPQAAQVWTSHPTKPFKSPVDFDNVNASVDQLSVDMNTIASSTDKMGQAIDSVGHAMQGMLFSLQQMAQDTGEGYKIVRGANNAATYTHNTASELAESALEMSRVVGRVTQLAMKTKQVSGQIQAEAVNTGSTGEAFTSVVAGEVKGLAQQTSHATAGIEQTVAEILGTARQYEEAIGQILKNISGINKVTENFGEMMLAPPAVGVAGTPLPPAPLPLAPQPVTAQPAAPPVVAQPAAQPVAPIEQTLPVEPTPAPAPVEAPVAVASAPVKTASTPEAAAPAEPDTWGQSDEPAAPEPSTEEVAEETAAAIEETASEPAGSSGNVFMLGGGKPKAKPAPAAKPAAEAKEEPKAEEPAPVAEEDDSANIFMLNKPKGAPAAKKEEPDPAPKPEPAAAATEDDGDSNIFMLNKPKKDPAATVEEPIAAVPTSEPTPEAAPSEEPKDEEPAPAEEKKEEGANVFMLNKPKAAPQADKEETPEVKEEPVTVPADDEEEEEKKDDGASNNVFMLNKPK